MRMGMMRRMMLEETNARVAQLAGAKNFACAAACAAVLLSGCRVGPKYVKPAAPAPAPELRSRAPAAYNNPPEGTTDAADGTWQPAQPQDAALKGKWWEVFNEPELNALEDQLNINNQNIAQYFQNFMAARAQVREAQSQYYPTLTTNPSYTRQTNAGDAAQCGRDDDGIDDGTGTGTTAVRDARGGTTSTDMSLPFDVSWEPDLWGKIRNTVREYQYAAQVSAAELENERLTEQAALAEFYFQLRGQDALQDLYNKTIEADQKSLELTQGAVRDGHRQR